MSLYEMMNYDELLQRIGIQPGEVWHCGDNPAPDSPYDGSGTYDSSASYGGYRQQGGGLCLTDDVNVNGLLLNHRDDNGTVWICTGVEGWWTLPPSEIPDVPQPYWDGSLLTTGRYAARTITITGTFLPPDKSWVWYNRDVLMRVASIVRGSGLIALCGNESPTNKPINDGVDDDGNPYQYLNPLYTPPKMAIIQMADVPLVDTVSSGGRTDFSLSFRCVQPTKLSIYERDAILSVPDSGFSAQRHYEAFSLEAPTDKATTEYDELSAMEGLSTTRTYGDVLNVRFDSLIKDEELTSTDPGPPPHPYLGYYDITNPTPGQPISTTIRNAGNYFAFPIFVFGTIDKTNPAAKPADVVTVQNVTTNEKMTVVGNVADGQQLVVDTGLRRVAVVNPAQSPDAWVWNDRSKLSLISQWVSLAPGNNTLICSKGPNVSLPASPHVLWRDTWIG